MLFTGDVVGSLGREALAMYIPKLKERYRPQVTIANDENMASGRGIIGKIYKKFLQGGADVATMGNHTWDNKDIFEFVDDVKKMARLASFPEDVPGQGIVFMKVSQLELAVINLQARTFMVPLEDPFKKAVELVAITHRRIPLIFVDFHSKTMSEKQAMSQFLDSQVSTITGAHTHVQINDARVLPKGTASLNDIGMAGPYNGILGMKRGPIIEKFMIALPKRFEVIRTGRTVLSTCILKIDDQTGQAEVIEPIQISEDHPS